MTIIFVEEEKILFKCMLDLRFHVQFPREIYRPLYAARY